MKKMPCLFQRDFTDKRRPVLLHDVTPGCEWVLAGEGIATRKWDGTACMVREGKLYKRYDAKNGKPAPENGIPCDDPDPVTGHWPHWIPVGDEPESKWHREACRASDERGEVMWRQSGTYELCGPHFNGNPEGLPYEKFMEHGKCTLHVPHLSFAGIREFLAVTNMEGIVFWKDGEPRCKIRRGDYGLPWGAKGRAA